MWSRFFNKLLTIPEIHKAASTQPTLPKNMFHIGDILSVVTGKNCSPNGYRGIAKLLNYMTNDNVYTHQLPRFISECLPQILKDYPQFAHYEIAQKNITDKNIDKWLKNLANIHGEYLPVNKIPQKSHLIKDPVEELEQMLLSHGR